MNIIKNLFGWNKKKEENAHNPQKTCGDSLEYKFLQYRSFEEGIVFRPKGYRLAGFGFAMRNQALCKNKYNL